MIGITGVATSGKDTLYFLLSKYFQTKKINIKRYALADQLKQDLQDFVFEKFNINLSSLSAKDKELIRPLMVSYGKIKRNQTFGRHWIEALDGILASSSYKDEIPVVTDIRYNEFEKDELFWLKNEKNGFLIHVSRVFEGKIISPANKEEEENDKLIYNQANYKLIWCTESNLELLYNTYEKNLEEIYNAYRRHRIN